MVRYDAASRVRDIIEDNYQLLMVLNRFRIPFGFGNSTIGKVCADNNVDCDTFLAVTNLISRHKYDGFNVDLSSLVCYLKEAHAYILEFILPTIKDLLIRGIHQSELNDVAMLTIKFFEEYIKEARNHMDYEDSFVFPYIEQLQEGILNPDFRIRDFATKHESMTTKLNEFKDLFLQHYVLPNSRTLNHALLSIIACGEDLHTHCEIENTLLVPAVERLERRVHAERPKMSKARQKKIPDANMKFEALSDREKDVIRLVAQGLSNKEIADRLCLSFHTITTYRKNISSKLNIHSAAALTIFAILNNIIDPQEIDLK